MDKTFYSIRDMSEKLGVSEKTIYRMLNDNQIPFAVKIGGQWRFRIDAVDGWLAGQGGPASSDDVNYRISLLSALNNGSVLYRIHGNNRDEALDELLATLPHSTGFDTGRIKMAILGQESLAASSLKGIACMSPGREVSFSVTKSIIILAFLEKSTDFKAIDRERTEIIFLTLPANEVEEAILNTRLRRLLMEPEFLTVLKSQPPRRELLQLVQETEERLLPLPSKKHAAEHKQEDVSTRPTSKG
jgi:PTS system nitrogen regulatory IIA component